MGDSDQGAGNESSPHKPTIEQIVADRLDPAGEPVVKVYSFNPPQYLIYRTRDRLVVEFAPGDDALASRQRKAISPLAPMRGQINGLIDGWRYAAPVAGDDQADLAPEADRSEENRQGKKQGETPWWRPLSPGEQFKRVCRYDRRVADALKIVLDDIPADGAAAITPTQTLTAAQTLDTAQTLLAQIKNDIIDERTSIARGLYIRWALLLAGGLLVATALLALATLAFVEFFKFNLNPAWTAVSGGVVGAFFSVAIGLKGREVVIDLQGRENQVDVVLRMLIGAISGGILYCLLASKIVTISAISEEQIGSAGSHSAIVVFLIGFVAGFFERLVPQLLNETNFGTREPAGRDTPIAKPLGQETKPKPVPGADADADADTSGDTGAGTDALATSDAGAGPDAAAGSEAATGTDTATVAEVAGDSGSPAGADAAADAGAADLDTGAGADTEAGTGTGTGDPNGAPNSRQVDNPGP